MVSTLFVVEDDTELTANGVNAIPFNAYLRDYPKRNEPKVRVINLCDTSRYLSQGYYCSLLAEARRHQVLPSVKVINLLRKNEEHILSLNLLPKPISLEEIPSHIVVCMGAAEDARWEKLASWAYQHYTAPILTLAVILKDGHLHITVSRSALSQLEEEQKKFCIQQLCDYAEKSWRTKAEKKKFRWDLAILINPNEAVPPSNKGALSRFVSAAEKHGIRATLITEQDFNSLAQYDALFIRETTAIDHYTYSFSTEAEKLGLVVMDDSNSILRCCNKVFLHDAFSYQKVPSLRTRILADIKQSALNEVEAEMGYPLILKMPEGAFSKGVFKIKSREEFEEVSRQLLQESALYIAQEYLFTEFDWRIGILNGRALFACRYYMAKNHWQIYNHKSKRNFSGGFDAVPTFEVPTKVLQAALQASAVIGDGLYGVDVKEVNGKAYVLEVNDNPSLEHGVEDHYLGEELYMQIMAEFLRRLELRGL